MYQEKNIAIDHGNRNMKTENLIFTSGLTVSEKQPPFGDYMSYRENIMHLQGRGFLTREIRHRMRDSFI